MAALPVKKLFIILTLGADFLEFHFIQLFHDLLTSAADSHKALAAVFIKLHQHPQCDQTVSTGITAKLRRILITDVPKLPADLIQLWLLSCLNGHIQKCQTSGRVRFSVVLCNSRGIHSILLYTSS